MFRLNLEASQKFSRSVVAVLQHFRKEKGFSQERLAEKAGISRTAITMMEAGKRNPTLFVVHALAKALEVDLSQIVREAEGSSRPKAKAR